MKAFLKTIIVLILVTAFLLTGCDTDDVLSETSSDISNLPSSVSEDSYYEESLDPSSVADFSADTSSAAPSDYTNVADVPDEVWQRIIDSQFTKDSPSFDGHDTWEEFIKDAKQYITNSVKKNYYPDDLSGERVLIRRYVKFNTKDYLLTAIEDVKKNGSLLSLNSEPLNVPNPTKTEFTIFNDDFTKGAEFRIHTIGDPNVELVYFDDTHNRFATNYWPYSYRWSWYQLTLNDTRKESLANSDLDLSKTTVTQIEIVGLGYGFIFSDGEHEYFMRTNDYALYEVKYPYFVVTEYEKLYSFEQVVSILENYPHFDENGRCIYESQGLPSYRRPQGPLYQ